MHPIDILVKRYPGLALPIKEALKQIEEKQYALPYLGDSRNMFSLYCA